MENERFGWVKIWQIKTTHTIRLETQSIENEMPTNCILQLRCAFANSTKPFTHSIQEFTKRRQKKNWITTERKREHTNIHTQERTEQKMIANAKEKFTCCSIFFSKIKVFLHNLHIFTFYILLHQQWAKKWKTNIRLNKVLKIWERKWKKNFSKKCYFINFL